MKEFAKHMIVFMLLMAASLIILFSPAEERFFWTYVPYYLMIFPLIYSWVLVYNSNRSG